MVEPFAATLLAFDLRELTVDDVVHTVEHHSVIAGYARFLFSSALLGGRDFVDGCLRDRKRLEAINPGGRHGRDLAAR